MPIGSIIGGMIGQAGAQQGGNMAKAGADEAAMRLQNAALADRRATSAYTSSGYGAQSELDALLGLGHLNPMSVAEGSYGDTSLNTADRTGDQAAAMGRFKTDPGYQFRLQEGVNALNRSGAAKGMSLSGAQAKALTDYGQNTGSAEYGNYFNRLAGVAGQGATSAAQTNAAVTPLFVAAGDDLTKGAATQGSAYASGANALASGISKGMQNLGAIAGFGGFGAFGGGSYGSAQGLPADFASASGGRGFGGY